MTAAKPGLRLSLLVAVVVALAPTAMHAQASDATRAEAEAACESGIAAICVRLASWHRVGAPEVGGMADPRVATDLYERACRLGSAPGCNAAGRMYEGADDGFSAGGPIPRYLVAAMHYHRMACDKGVAGSCDAFEGLFDLSDRESACTAGDVAACKEVGDFAFGMSPFLDTPDYPRAVRMFRRACDLGDLDACASLGVLYQTGGPKAGPAHATVRDFGKARHYYGLACNGGMEGSCLSLSIVDVLAAAESGCAAGDPVGCRELAWRASLGAEVRKDPARAVDLAARACDGGDGLGCALLGVFLEAGNGTAADPALAREKFLRAKALAPGDPQVRQALQERGIQ